MNIEKIKQEVYEIFMMEEMLSEGLVELSRFFLISLSYLQGKRVWVSYRESFEETCRILQEQEDSCRMAPVLDALMASVFYYKLALTGPMKQRKTNQLHFSLSLQSCYGLLLQQFAEETGEEVACDIDGTYLFDELFLLSKPVKFSKKEVCGETRWMYRYLREKGLLVGDSYFENALMRHKRSLLMMRFPWMKVSRDWGIGVCVTLGLFLFIAIARIAYNMCVEFPLLRLLSMERAGKVYDHKLVEVALQCRSFIDNGVAVFGSRVLFFCLAIILVIGIEYLIRTWSDRIYSDESQRK